MLKVMIPALLLSVFVPNVAAAQEGGHAAVHVAYRDLDLRSPAGVKQLDRRIERAIAEVCPDSGETDLARKLAISACRAVKRAGVAEQRAKVLAYGARREAELAAVRTGR